MRSKLLWLSLAVSLGFNLFFVIGYATTGRALRKARTPAGRMELIAQRLELDEEQQERLDGLWAGTRRQGRELWEASLESREALWRELDRDEPSAERLHALVEESMGLQLEAQLLAIDKTLELLRILDQDQRQALLRMAKKRAYLRGEF
jgi:hypothetical protein